MSDCQDRSRIPALCCLLGLLSASAGAQQVVVPDFAATREGNSIYAYPLSFNQARLQVLLEASELGTLRIARNLAFRPDGGGTTNTYAATTLQASLTVYQVTTSAAGMRPAWASNIGSASGTTVFNGTLKLPAFVTQYPLPNPFRVVIPFSAPFIYQPANGNLLLDWKATAASYLFSRYNIDGVSYPQTPGSLVTRVFRNTNCANRRGDKHAIALARSTGILGQSIVVKSTPKAAVGGKLDIELLILGGSNKLAFGNVPLPLYLGSAYPGCALSVDPLLFLPTNPIPLPANPSLAGTHLYFQGFAADSATGDFVLSADAWSLRVLDNPPKIRGFQSVFLSKWSNQPTGVMSMGFFYAPVVRLN